MKRLIPLMIIAVVGCATQAQPPVALPVPPPVPPNEDVIIVAQAPQPSGLPAATPLPPKAPRVHIEPTGSTFKFGLSPGSSSSRRTLVIPKGEANSEFLANAEEDLNV